MLAQKPLRLQLTVYLRGLSKSVEGHQCGVLARVQHAFVAREGRPRLTSDAPLVQEVHLFIARLLPLEHREGRGHAGLPARVPSS